MEIRQAVKTLAALAQETRLSVFRALVEVGPEGLAAGQLAERMAVPAATLSFHLKELVATGLIAQTRDGRSLIYSLRPDGIQELLRFLMEDCCQGQPELCQPGFIEAGCQDGVCREGSVRRKKSKASRK